MSNKYLGMKNEDLPVKYGLIDFGPVRPLAFSSFSYVCNDLDNINHNFVSLAFHLNEIEMFEYYKDFGYSNIYDFSEKNFNLEKSQVNRLISVIRTFGFRTDSNVIQCRLIERFNTYSYSQLVELLNINAEDRVNYPSTMSVREIREKKKQKKNRDSFKESIATSQQIDNNYLCVSDLIDYSGIVKSNKIKNADVRDMKRFEIYDSNGKLVKNEFYDILLSSDTYVVVRIRS